MTILSPFEIPLSGTNLVEASAGTGKTYTLTTLYLRLLAETELRVSNILVVTFTEAATKELAIRIRERLESVTSGLRSNVHADELVERYVKDHGEGIGAVASKFERALREFDDAAIFTIHGFCKRLLEDNAFESGVPFDAKLVKNIAGLQQEIVQDFFALRIYDSRRVVARYFASRNVWPAELVKLVKSASMGADTALLPEEVDPGDVVEEFVRAFEGARDCWEGNRQEIVDLLMEQSALNQRSFSKKTMPKWFEELDAYFGPSDLACPLRIDKSNRPAASRLTTEKLKAGTKKNQKTPTHPFFSHCEDLARASMGFDKVLVAFKRDLIEYSKEQLAARMRKERTWSFDDLLSFARDALKGEGGPALRRAITRRFKAVLIDEFQDTDNLQYEIFSNLFGAERIPMYLIGDPKQAIYGFRGANIYTYLEAARSAGSNTCRLDTNWRSEPGLVSAINQLFGAPDNPFSSEGISYSPVKPRRGAKGTLESTGDFSSVPFQVRFIERLEGRVAERSKVIAKRWAKKHLPSIVAKDIVQLLSSRVTIEGNEVRPKDVAVLTRKNEQAEGIRSALSDLGVPAILMGKESVFASTEAEELRTVLGAVLNPGRPGLVKAALVTGIFGFVADEIRGLDESEEHFATVQSAFFRWRDLWFEKGIVSALWDLLGSSVAEGTGSAMAEGTGSARSWRVGAGILSLAGGERRLSNVRHLVELLDTARNEHGGAPREMLRWFDSRLNHRDPESEEDGLRLETDGDAVRVITTHKAKGLEFKAVYCPYVWDGGSFGGASSHVVYHDAANGWRRTLDLGTSPSRDRMELARKEEFQENLRLLYVALTRAKSLCVVYFGGFRDADGSALGYLLHQGAEAVTPEAVKKRIGSMSDGDMLEDLSRFASLADRGAVEVKAAQSKVVSPYVAKPLHDLGATPTRFGGTIPRGTEVYSFTGFVGDGASPEVSHLTEEGDRQARVPIVLDAFERGRRSGRCIHGIFENLDFEERGQGYVENVVSNQLTAHGFDEAKWAGPVSEMVREVCRTRFSSRSPKLHLGCISNRKRIVELPFLFLVATVDPMSAHSLAAIMNDPAFGSVATEYAERLKGLGFRVDSGFVKGFVDLVFEWEGRYYLVDYKSNHLGSSVTDYSPENLMRAMVGHDYILQYHLYVVALHRYLESRIEGYDYDTHFGEVAYLFVRGMSEETGAVAGVFTDRPPKELVKKLCESFGSPKKEEGGPHD